MKCGGRCRELSGCVLKHQVRNPASPRRTSCTGDSVLRLASTPPGTSPQDEGLSSASFRPWNMISCQQIVPNDDFCCEETFNPYHPSFVAKRALRLSDATGDESGVVVRATVRGDVDLRPRTTTSPFGTHAQTGRNHIRWRVSEYRGHRATAKIQPHRCKVRIGISTR